MLQNTRNWGLMQKFKKNHIGANPDLISDFRPIPADESLSGPVASTISRRSVAAGIAWAVPVITAASAAPAFADSGCVVQTNFDNLAVGSRPTTLYFPPSTITASVAFTSTGNGGDNTPGDTGLVEATNTTPPWNYIEMEMLSSLRAGDSITATITLTAPVENLSFILHDIDSEQSAWRDEVVVNTPGWTAVLGPGLQGAGTSANPYRPNAVGDYPISSGQGDLRLTWAGPVSSVSFTYRAGINGNSQNQHIGLGNISFSDCVANPSVRSRMASRAIGMTPVTGFIESDGSTDQ